MIFCQLLLCKAVKYAYLRCSGVKKAVLYAGTAEKLGLFLVLFFLFFEQARLPGWGFRASVPTLSFIRIGQVVVVCFRCFLLSAKVVQILLSAKFPSLYFHFFSPLFSISTSFTFRKRSDAKTRSLRFSLVDAITSSFVPCHSFLPL